MEIALKDSKNYGRKMKNGSDSGKNCRHLRDWIGGPCRVATYVMGAVAAVSVAIVYILDVKSMNNHSNENSNRDSNRNQRR